MSRKNITRSKKQKKTSCGCKKSLRLWGGKKRKSNRRTRKTVRGGFVIGQTYPHPSVSCANTIPFSENIGGSGDPTTPANVVDARQTNLL